MHKRKNIISDMQVCPNNLDLQSPTDTHREWTCLSDCAFSLGFSPKYLFPLITFLSYGTFSFTVLRSLQVFWYKVRTTMAPGPPNLGDNRFALLSSSPKPKRKKTTYKALDFPELPHSKQDNPKFITISAADAAKPLSKYSCFAIHKAIEIISKEIISITELRDGNILLLVKTPSIANKFLAVKRLNGICDVKVNFQENLNFSKGTIYAPCLNDVPDEEIIENMKDQGVVAVFKFKKIINKAHVPTGVVLLTFDLYKLPEKVQVSWRTARVKPHFPNPMRCKSCQLLGHTTKRCNNNPACVTCNFPPHGEENCLRTLCVNCAGEHPSSSNTCSKYLQAKQVLKVKTENKCSMREAIRIYKSQIPSLSNTSFAQVLKSNEQQKQTNSTDAITFCDAPINAKLASNSRQVSHSNTTSDLKNTILNLTPHFNNNSDYQTPSLINPTSNNIHSNNTTLISNSQPQTFDSLQSTFNNVHNNTASNSCSSITNTLPQFISELQSQSHHTQNLTLSNTQTNSISIQQPTKLDCKHTMTVEEEEEF